MLRWKSRDELFCTPTLIAISPTIYYHLFPSLRRTDTPFLAEHADQGDIERGAERWSQRGWESDGENIDSPVLDCSAPEPQGYGMGLGMERGRGERGSAGGRAEAVMEGARVWGRGGTAWQLNPPWPVYWGARLIEQQHTNTHWQPGLRGGCPASIHNQAPALMHCLCVCACVYFVGEETERLVNVCVLTMVIFIEWVGLSLRAFEWFQGYGIVTKPGYSAH